MKHMKKFSEAAQIVGGSILTLIGIVIMLWVSYCTITGIYQSMLEMMK